MGPRLSCDTDSRPSRQEHGFPEIPGWRLSELSFAHRGARETLRDGAVLRYRVLLIDTARIVADDDEF